MKTVVGVLFIILGLLVGLYLGLWVCFIGGIVAVVEAVKATPTDAQGIAIGAVRVMLTGVVFWFCFLFGGFVGGAFLNSGSYRGRR